MRYGIFATTARGARLALSVRELLNGESTVFIKKGKSDASGIVEYNKISELMEDVFYKYDGLIFIMATGIVVRSIAPYIVNKLKDPAVVVMDEEARHVISLLSGHMGGANALTRQLAQQLNSDPVITTATDVNNLQAPDALAAEIGLKVYPKERIMTLNSAVLEGKKFQTIIDRDMSRRGLYQQKFLEKGVKAKIADVSSLTNYDELLVVVTEKKLPVYENVLYLMPRKLIAGVGCRRGTSTDMIYNALEMACQVVGKKIVEIDMLASVTAKADEAGLLEVSDKIGKPIEFFSPDELQLKVYEYGLAESEFVKENIGVGNVSEASALCCVDRGQIILNKMKYGKVTVSLVWER